MGRPPPVAGQRSRTGRSGRARPGTTRRDRARPHPVRIRKPLSRLLRSALPCPASAPAGPPVPRHDRRTRCAHDRDRGPLDRPDPRPARAGDDALLRHGAVAARRVDLPRRRLPARACTGWSAASCGCWPTWPPGRRTTRRSAPRRSPGTPTSSARCCCTTTPSSATRSGRRCCAPCRTTALDEVRAALDEWTARCARIDHMLRDVATAARQWCVAAHSRGAPGVRRRLPGARRRRRRADRRRGAHAPAAAGGAPPARGLGGDRAVGALPAHRPRTAPGARPRAGGLLRRRPGPAARRPVPRRPVRPGACTAARRYRAAVVRLRGEPPAR